MGSARYVDMPFIYRFALLIGRAFIFVNLQDYLEQKLRWRGHLRKYLQVLLCDLLGA